MNAASHSAEAVWLAAFALILAFLPIFAPLPGLVVSILAPFPLIVLAVKYPWRYVLGVSGMQVGGLLVFDAAQAVATCIQGGMMAIAMGWAIRRQYTVSRTVVWSLAIPLCAAGFLLLCWSVVTQQSPYQILLHEFERVLRAAQEYLQTAEPGQDTAGESLATVAETLPQFMLLIFPALVIVNQLYVNVVSYLCVRCYGKRTGLMVRGAPQDLAHWRATDHLVWVFLVSGAALLVPLPPIGAIGLNVFVITLAIYLLQGVAILVFWSRRMPLSPGVRFLLGLLLLVFGGPLCVIGCIAAGLFDLWIDFRRQRSRPIAP